MIRVGFDVSQTGRNRAGCGHYAHALATYMPALAEDVQFRFHPDFGDFFFDPAMPLTNPYPGHGSTYGPRHIGRDGAASFWSATDLEARLGNPDILHSNNFWCPRQLRHTRLVYTLYDLAFAIHPDWTTEENRVGCADGLIAAAAFADWIVAISEASRADFLRTFPHFPVERTRVIHPCSRFHAASVRAQAPALLKGRVPHSFWLCVGTLEPRKNHRMLLRAYADYLGAGGEPMPLVIAGGRGWQMDEFPGQIAAAGLADRVVLTGYVSDAELVWLYRNCFANLYPSLFEGFGLPVLEAMQFGAPTICSNLSSLPEVAGDGALLLAPADAPAWARAMLELSRSPSMRDELARRGMLRAEGFSWRESAEALLRLYREAAASPRRTQTCDVR